MAEVRFSRWADADLAEIAEYTIAKFGISQARRYRDGLPDCLRLLAEDPTLGRRADAVAPGLRRFAHESRVVFFVPAQDGIFIVRGLHKRMDVDQRFS